VPPKHEVGSSNLPSRTIFPITKRFSRARPGRTYLGPTFFRRSKDEVRARVALRIPDRPVPGPQECPEGAFPRSLQAVAFRADHPRPRKHGAPREARLRRSQLATKLRQAKIANPKCPGTPVGCVECRCVAISGQMNGGLASMHAKKGPPPPDRPLAPHFPGASLRASVTVV
jgi:hypothetical protein